MRVVVGSDLPSELKKSEIDRHLRFIAEFIERAERGEEPLSVSMMLRAANSNAAEALMGLSAELMRAGISAKVLVTRLDPECDLRRLFASLSELSPNEPAKNLIRWMRNPRLLDAHEQAVYGMSMSWSGDAMRRDADKRNALSLFEAVGPGKARLARQAFRAMWAASSPIAEARLMANGNAKPSGTYQPDQTSQLALLRLRPSLQGWPLLRH